MNASPENEDEADHKFVDDADDAALEESDESLMRGSPPDVPNPRFSWIAAGATLIIGGVILTLSMVMLAIGVLMCAAGVGLMVSAFLSNEGRDLRIFSNPKERILSWVPQEREIKKTEEDSLAAMSQMSEPKTQKPA